MVVLLKIIQVILALSLLVLFHEFGHYSFAKLFKTRVEKFYLFFNPRISLLKFKRFGGKWHCKAFSSNDDPEWDAHPEHTEYGIGWLPFGGYCKIAGMIDESMDTEAMKLPPQPYEFRTKKAWQRFFIMFGGVLFNFILAIILYAAILGTWGEEFLRNEDAVYGVAVNDLSAEIGFRDGDRILAFDGVPVGPGRYPDPAHRPGLSPGDAQHAGHVRPGLPLRREGSPGRIAQCRRRPGRGRRLRGD